MRQPDDARPGATIGGRVVATVWVLTALTLALMVFTLHSLSRASIENRVQRELSMVADELTVLARDGVNPQTGRPFDNPRDLLRVAVQRSVLSRNEGEFAVVNGDIVWLAPDPIPLRLEQDAAVVDATVPLAAGDQVVQLSLASQGHDWRITVVPVVYPGQQRGALVRAMDVSVEYAELDATFRNAVVIGALGVVLAGVVVWLLLGRLLAPLSLVRRTAARLSESDLSERIPVRGNDDLSALSVTINAMLDRLSSAVTHQKRLTDDVSHELRTPLTIMRGNLELLDPSDPELVAMTRSTLLGVVDRMQRLVDDLLTLAQADRPDFLHRRPVDAAQLTDEIAELARGLGDRRWRLDHLADATVDVDPDRLSQALLQLAQNAVKYSQPGATVTLGSRVADGTVQFYVSDTGVGIPADDLPTIRERFGRAEGARRAGVEGSGLGLAIVDTIAKAHRGRLDIESTEGLGSRFTISIPVEVSDDHSDR